MSDDTSIKAYWGQLVQKRYWREVMIGMPPRDPWAPTGDMLVHQFDKKKPAQVEGNPTPLDMAVTYNAAYLDVADGRYMRRGFGGMMFTLLMIPFLIVDTLVLSSALTNKFHSIFGSLVLLALVVVFGGPLLFMIGYQWKLEMLDYTYKPIRLVRSTRKVHVFQHNGPGGVWSLDWDKLQFCLKKGGLNWGVLGYLSDANGQVTHAFYLGAFLPVNPKGIGPDEPLLAHWEYFRRYMEDGPASVPTPAVLLPIRNRREPFLFGMRQSWRTFGPYLILALPFAPLTTLAGVFRWLGMHMSRVPRWPAQVEAQCQLMAGDTTVQPTSNSTGNNALIAVGAAMMLALDAVLLWLLFTRVFGIDRILIHHY